MVHTRVPILRRGHPRKRPIDSLEIESPERSARVELVRQGQTRQDIICTSDYKTPIVPTSEVHTSTIPRVVSPSVYPAPPPVVPTTTYLRYKMRQRSGGTHSAPL